MNKKQLHMVWWLCMLPSLSATAMLYFVWTQNQSETILLSFAIVSLLVGVVAGTLIVRYSLFSESKKENPKVDIKANARAAADGAAEQTDTQESVDRIKQAESPVAPDFKNTKTSPAKHETLPTVRSQTNESTAGADHIREVENSAHLPCLRSEVSLQRAESREAGTKISAKNVTVSTQSTNATIALGPSALDRSEFELLVDRSAEKVEQAVSRLKDELDRAEKVAAKLESELVKTTKLQNDRSAETNKKQAQSCLIENQKAPPASMRLSGSYSAAKSSGVLNLLYSCEMLIAENKYEEALKCCDKITSIAAQNADGWRMKATALRLRKSYEDSLYCINHALYLRKTSISAMTEKGECLLQMGRVQQAIIWFDKALSTDKTAVNAWSGKARCLDALGRHKDALACHKKILLIQESDKEGNTALPELNVKSQTGEISPSYRQG